MNIIKIFATVTLSVSCIFGSIAQNNIQNAIDRFVDNDVFRHASVGISVMSIDSNKVVGEHTPAQSCVCASTMKTITSSVALAKLGANFQFHTKVLMNGEISADSTLNGNIIIVGGGDPTLGSQYIKNDTSFIKALIQALKDRGVKAIHGGIITDDSAYPFPANSPFWMGEDYGYDYGTGIHALNYKDNAFDLRIDVSGNNARIVSTKPNVEYVTFKNFVNVYNSSDSLSSTGIDPVMDFGTNTYYLFGNIKRRTQPVYISCANPDPAKLLFSDALDALENAGIKVGLNNISTDTESEVILDYKSPKLKEIINSLLVRSDNMFTEGVLRAIARNAGKEPTAANGVSVVKNYWKSKGLDVSGLWMYDGSGLSRTDKVPAEFYSNMLAIAYRNRIGGEDFASLLPRSGKNGTLRKLLANTKGADYYALKSGSMSAVQCYVGYFPADNPKYTIALLVNNFNCSTSKLRSLIERLLLDLMEE